MKGGDTVKLTVFRNDVLREFEVTLRNQDVLDYQIAPVGSRTDLQKAILEDWLKTNWGNAKN